MSRTIMLSIVRRLSATAVLAVLFVAAGHAQDTHNPPGKIGIGGMVGDPSGFAVKVYAQADRSIPLFGGADAYDFLIAWDLDSFFFFNAHALIEQPIVDSPLNYFLGPGVVVGIRDTATDTDFVLGLSGNFGVNYFVEQFEVFLQVTPRLNLVPDTRGVFGGGVGLRYYFKRRSN